MKSRLKPGSKVNGSAVTSMQVSASFIVCTGHRLSILVKISFESFLLNP